MLGREETKRLYRAELNDHGIDIPEYFNAHGVPEGGCTAMQIEDTEKELGSDEQQELKGASTQERLEKAEAEMSEWLSLRQRCDSKTLIGRTDNHIRAMKEAIQNANKAIRVTNLVSEAYGRIMEANDEQKQRIRQTSTNAQLSAEDQCLLLQDEGDEKKAALSAAVDEVWQKHFASSGVLGSSFCTFKESVGTACCP